MSDALTPLIMPFLPVQCWEMLGPPGAEAWGRQSQTQEKAPWERGR